MPAKEKKIYNSTRTIITNSVQTVMANCKRTRTVMEKFILQKVSANFLFAPIFILQKVFAILHFEPIFILQKVSANFSLQQFCPGGVGDFPPLPTQLLHLFNQ
jgi:hypothetical protein